MQGCLNFYSFLLKFELWERIETTLKEVSNYNIFTINVGLAGCWDSSVFFLFYWSWDSYCTRKLQQV